MSDTSKIKPERTSSAWPFFLLVIILSIPFYVLGAAGGRLPFAAFFPMSALMAFVPMIAALALVYRARGLSGAKALLGRALDYRSIRGMGWVLAALLLMPIVYLLAYGALHLDARALPEVQFYPIAAIAAFALVFFIAAIGEELGWQGFAYAELKRDRSALAAALIVGTFWALWHVIPNAQMGHDADWIVWQGLGTIALRVIIVWLFESAGQSVFVAVLCHTMTNMPWGTVQNYESLYDPLVMFVILALAIGIVFVGRGSLRRRASD